jgi:hypothetical protein|tara:strand:+ start:1527 stop:1751 length:225 start_codon:yes stop_codon:yes gene_type:complete
MIDVTQPTTFRRLKMSDFMKLDEAIEIVMELATDSVLDDGIIANDPHLSDEQARQETAIATVEDFFVNNVFEGD